MTVTAESRLETLEKEFESWLVLIYLHLFADRKNDSPHNKTCSKWQGYIWATHLVSTCPCRLWFSPVKFTRTLYQKIRLILRNHSLNSEADVTSSNKMLLHLSVIYFFIYCPPSDVPSTCGQRPAARSWPVQVLCSWRIRRTWPVLRIVTGRIWWALITLGEWWDWVKDLGGFFTD